MPAMEAVARENFVPRAATALAYADVPVEVAPGRYLLDPRSFAKAAATGPGARRKTGCWMWAAAPAIRRRCWHGCGQWWWRWSRTPIWFVLPASCWQMPVGNVEVTQGALIEGFKDRAGLTT